MGDKEAGKLFGAAVKFIYRNTASVRTVLAAPVITRNNERAFSSLYFHSISKVELPFFCLSVNRSENTIDWFITGIGFGWKREAGLLREFSALPMYVYVFTFFIIHEFADCIFYSYGCTTIL